MTPHAVYALLQGYQRVVVAYSGGVDSHVLLHLLSGIGDQGSGIGEIVAVHVNHQLNPKAESWALHCQAVCHDLKTPLHIEKIDIELKSGDSLEEKAREARYSVLKKYLDENAVLVTAHNANDQAETFLLQALRGAGPKGLSAMPVKKKLGDSFLIRPLLTISRDEIEKYAVENKLKWIEDDSNVDTKFNRNYLRQNIFPILKKRFPAVMESFSRSARLIAEQEKVISEIAQLDYEHVVETRVEGCTQPATSVLHIQKLLQLSGSRQRLVLREWFRQNNLRMPNEKHLKQIQKDVLNAAPDAHPIFKLSDFVLTRERGFLKLQ